MARSTFATETADAVASAGLERPEPFCQVRSFLADLGLERTLVRAGEEIVVPAIDVPDALLRFIVPVMLLIMAVRFAIRGLASIGSSITGAPDPDRTSEPSPGAMPEGG